MKELTIEEKAQRYDEAIEKTRIAYKDEDRHLKATLESIFPELKEIEDERMWKLIKKYAHCNISDMALDADHITREQLESWLEKQGEQKSVYITPVSITDEWIEDYWQHEKVNNPYSHDKGEEIQFDHQGFVRFCKKYCKKPTAWGQVDERNLKCIMKIIKEKAFTDYDVDEDNNMLGIYAILESWLKSLKQRYTWKPSDEQLYFLHWLANNVLTDGEVDKKASEILNTLYDDLKKL